MRQRQRDDQDSVRQTPPAAPDARSHETAAAQGAAERFLVAADEAIDRALSGDSEAFLAASRQTSAQ
jgi:hypothetical protein